MSFTFPSPTTADEQGRVCMGGDLEPETLLAAYRSGIFPVPSRGDTIGWWSYDPRGVLELDSLRVSDSLRRSRRQFEIRVDTAFEAVIDGCADAHRGEFELITPAVRSAYVALHRLGWAHSVEAWSRDEAQELVGGLYGVGIGGLFSGESMFYRRRDASKAALVALVELLRDDGRNGAGRLLDVQEVYPLMASLGAVEIPRTEYLERLERALELPPPPAFGRGGHVRPL